MSRHRRADLDRLPTDGRLLAVDVGEVRIGLATSDPTQTVGSPAETVAAPAQASATVALLVDAVARHEAVGVVVGYPRTLAGREGRAARRCRELAEELADAVDVPVVLWDERFTTTEAERVMLAQDARRAERRRSIDRVAAALILQGVLEARRSRR